MSEMKEKQEFATIRQMEQAYYPPEILEAIRNKTADPVLRETAGYRNVIYGSNVWNALIYNTDLITGLLPKDTWQNSGYRIRTSRTVQSPGIAEMGNLPEPVKPEVLQIKVSPKEAAKTVQMSRIAYDTEANDDNVRWAEIVDDTTNAYLSDINKVICADNQIATGNNFDSIDKIIASNGELTTCSLSAGSLDIYGIDRDSGGSPWADSQIDCAAAARAFNLNQLGNLITKCKPYWANKNSAGKRFITGYDTVERIEQLLLENKVYNEGLYKTYTVGSEGATVTNNGTEAGIMVATFKGIPIFGIGDIAQPENELSRVYLVDPDRLKFAVVSPVEYTETTDPFILNNFSRMGLYYMSGNLVCTGFGGQGKLRDISVE